MSSCIETINYDAGVGVSRQTYRDVLMPALVTLSEPSQNKKPGRLLPGYGSFGFVPGDGDILSPVGSEHEGLDLARGLTLGSA